MSEAAWQADVVRLAGYYGWAHFHPYEMRRSDAGWPDLVFIRPPEILFIELKTDKGKVSASQQWWLDALAACGLTAQVWRPRDLEEAHAILKRRKTPSYQPTIRRLKCRPRRQTPASDARAVRSPTA